MFSPADMCDTKFKVGVIYPPEKQKFLEDMLHAKAAEQGIEIGGPTGQMEYIFTLDEAQNFFKSMKEAQDMVLAKKAGE